ncbi:uncharacterized protein [Ambystoma mexicanum]|uniref:uncharacterized protein n=1 Tax=Ambystoma mexicanum TaxID=8296 RepID=UPI0037E94DFF
MVPVRLQHAVLPVHACSLMRSTGKATLQRKIINQTKLTKSRETLSPGPAEGNVSQMKTCNSSPVVDCSNFKANEDVEISNIESVTVKPEIIEVVEDWKEAVLEHFQDDQEIENLVKVEELSNGDSDCSKEELKSTSIEIVLRRTDEESFPKKCHQQSENEAAIQYSKYDEVCKKEKTSQCKHQTPVKEIHPHSNDVDTVSKLITYFEIDTGQGPCPMSADRQDSSEILPFSNTDNSNAQSYTSIKRSTSVRQPTAIKQKKQLQKKVKSYPCNECGKRSVCPQV